MIHELYRVECDNCGVQETMDGPNHLGAEYIITKLYGWKVDDYGEYCSVPCQNAARNRRDTHDEQPDA